jgi:hypothetical protein
VWRVGFNLLITSAQGGVRRSSRYSDWPFNVAVVTNSGPIKKKAPVRTGTCPVFALPQERRFSSSTPTTLMTSTLNAVDSNQRSIESQKTVTYFHAVCLILTREIGAGIFSSPTIVNRNSGSAVASLLIWMSTGFVAWAGAGNSLHLVLVIDSILCRTWLIYTRNRGGLCLYTTCLQRYISLPLHVDNCFCRQPCLNSSCLDYLWRIFYSGDAFSRL